MSSRGLMITSFLAMSLVAFAPVRPSPSIPATALTAASLASFDEPVPPALQEMLAVVQTMTPQSPSSTPGARRVPPQPVDLSEQFLDECMAVAEQVNPEWARRMRMACEKQPEDFAKFIRQQGRQLVGLVELKRRDPKLYEIKLDELKQEAQLRATLHKLRHLQSEGLDQTEEGRALQADLRMAVTSQVALSLRARAEYIHRLEEHLAAMRQQMEADALNFFRTVESRFQMLIAVPEDATDQDD